MNVTTNINLNQNELQNSVIEPLRSAPANPKMGQVYFDELEGKFMGYDGVSWAPMGGAAGSGGGGATDPNSHTHLNKGILDDLKLLFWTGTQSQFDAISSKDPTTLYIIT